MYKLELDGTEENQLYSSLPDHSDFLCKLKAEKVEICAIKVAKICHHFTILVILGSCLVVFLDVIEIWDVKFVDYFDRDGDCVMKNMSHF